ncbi:MAG: peptidoglycan bridge formation glycyltransferase FemA/FemB family protein [Candidatus Komeilibacteria bacterium]|nr:peptidoglycan bridge formation glycyltransferase FemA/FemB family protein [Candidatus Komeilibacteria bacterium]
MNYRLKIGQPADRALLSRNFDISYTKEFFAFQEKYYGLKSDFLFISAAEDEILAALPFNINEEKKDFYAVYKNYSFPYFAQPAVKLDWLELARTIKNDLGYKYVAFRLAFLPENFGQKNLKLEPVSAYVINTADQDNEETFLARASIKTRNQIKKAQKSGLIIKNLAKNRLEDIYNLYQENMRWHGTPPKSMDFFRDFFSCFNERCFALGAFAEDKLIGVNLAVTAEAGLKLFFNFSNRAYRNQCVNDLLYFKMLTLAQQTGVRHFDLGTCANDDSGHIHFKLGFGAVKIPLWHLSYGSMERKLYFFYQQKRRNLIMRWKRLSRKF